MTTGVKIKNKTNMSSESLEKLGLFFDELNRVRVWEPEAADKTNDLKDECKDFSQSKSIIIIKIRIEFQFGLSAFFSFFISRCTYVRTNDHNFNIGMKCFCRILVSHKLPLPLHLD